MDWNLIDDPVWDIVNNSIAAGAFVGFLTFVVIYSTRNWRATPPGRSLMYAIGSLDLVVLMNTVHLFTGRYQGILVVRTIVYGLLFYTAWRFVHTLVKSIRGGNTLDVHLLFERKEKKEGAIKMNGVSSKLASAGVAGAITGVAIWVVSLFGLDVPPEVAVYISVIIGAVVGWFVPETRAIPIEHAQVSATVSEINDPTELV